MDRINRRLEIERRFNDFDEKYNKIIKMKSKTPLELLKLEIAINELLNE